MHVRVDLARLYELIRLQELRIAALGYEGAHLVIGQTYPVVQVPEDKHHVMRIRRVPLLLLLHCV
jgi:hypothetical protein